MSDLGKVENLVGMFKTDKIIFYFSCQLYLSDLCYNVLSTVLLSLIGIVLLDSLVSLQLC